MVGTVWLLSTARGVAADDKPQPPQDAPKRGDPARLLEEFDKNKDGALDRSEVPDPVKRRFDQIDADKDGKLSKAELEKFMGRGGQPPAAQTPDTLFRLLDANNDGKLSKAELDNAAKLLEKLDKNKDGTIDRNELPSAPRPGGGRPGEVITPAAKGERQTDKLKVGDPAPDFTLPLLSDKGQVTLSSFQEKKPVVLIFASYT